ncbi:Acid phosphatase-like protein 2 [Entomortierella beljakovae]|nr:Acid phosphatase-like protein 2 [Entomortierella beljakovae]
MALNTRVVIILVIISVGGLILATARFNKSDSQNGPIALGLLDDDVDVQENEEEVGFHLCHAHHPTKRTYLAPKTKGATLVNSQVFIRHGDRTPISVLPLDLNVTWNCANMAAYAFTGFGADPKEKAPFQHANIVSHQVVTIPSTSPYATNHMWRGSCIPGQLTPIGAIQHRRLGAALRRIYVDELKFLPETLDPKITYIRSTDVWRTKQSAENLMAGLYGVREHSQMSPPPVLQLHVLPLEIDYLTMNTGACPRISQLQSELVKSSEIMKSLQKDNVEFNKELVEILGAEKTWSGYMDTIIPRICHKIPLQCRKGQGGNDDKCITANTTNRILENLAIQTTEYYRDGPGIHDVLRLGMGPIAKDIKANLMNAKANGKNRFSLYSGHDTTILPLIGMFDGSDVSWPPYASNILVELWKSPKDELFVRVLYNGAILQTKSNWCDLEWCPLDTFVQYLDTFIVQDMATSCVEQ